MSRVLHYMTGALRHQWRIALVLAVSPMAASCVGPSIPLGELSASAPAKTGSVQPASSLPQPLPAGLAPSDAVAIGEAARRAFAAGPVQPAEAWENPATGSSGTLAALRSAVEEAGEICRSYIATVASVRGVHRFTSRACRATDGGVTVRSIEPDPLATLRSAGI